MDRYRCGGTGLPQASGLFVSLPLRRAIALLGREGPMFGRVIVSCIMPWRSSFPCHRMCCGPDTLLWFAFSVFRSADMIGIDGHVSLVPPSPPPSWPADSTSFCVFRLLWLLMGSAVILGAPPP